MKNDEIGDDSATRHLAFIEKLNATTPACATLGIRVLEATPGRSRIKMRIADTMLNGMGNAHGGMIFALADTAFAFAANTADKTMVSQFSSITFLDKARSGEELIASAVAGAEAGRIQTFIVSVNGDDGRPIAQLSMVGKRVG